MCVNREGEGKKTRYNTLLRLGCIDKKDKVTCMVRQSEAQRRRERLGGAASYGSNSPIATA